MATNFLDTKTLYDSNTVTKEFWEKFKNSYKIFSPPDKASTMTKSLKQSMKVKTSTLSPQPYSSFGSSPNDADETETDVQDRLMQINLDQLQAWSPNNIDLYKKFMELGFTRDLVNKSYLVGFYQDLRLEDLKIDKIDKDVMSFTNLESLSLSRNNIQIVENLPPDLKEISLYYNNISFIRAVKPYENIVYLGLGYNRLGDNVFDGIHVNFPKLLSLDLSYNDVCNLDTASSSLTFCKNLKMLNLLGNPLTLIPHYRATILEDLRMLKVFDNEKVNREESYKMSSMKQTKAKESAPTKESPLRGSSRDVVTRPSTLHRNVEIPPEFSQKSVISEDPLEVEVKFVVSICTLEEVVGVNFNDLCNPNGDKPVENYQTSYWASLSIMDSYYESKSQKVLFDACTVENESARLDFEFSTRCDVTISTETRDFFRNGLVITIHKQEPLHEDSEVEGEKRPVLKDNEVQVEEKVIGVCRIDLKSFLEPKAETKPALAQKHRLWPENCRTVAEFLYPVKDEALKVKKIIEKTQKPVEEQKIEIAVPDPKKGAAKGGKEVPKKDTKKDTKKDSKKATKKGGKDDPPEKKPVALLEWPVNPREKVLVEKDNKMLDPIPNQLLAVKVEVGLNPR